MKQMVVFVSSTFRDMADERYKLLHGAFRQLEFEAGLKGIRFTTIDLRWGITSASSEMETIRRCLDLVGECKPFFLALIGGRYGWVPPSANLQALTPPFKDRPTEGTSVTELEILRFFENIDAEPEDPKGLFFFLKAPDFETPMDQERLARLRSRIESEASVGRAEVHQYSDDASGLSEMNELTLSFFRRRIDEIDEGDSSSAFPASALSSVPDDVIRGWPEHAAAITALGNGRILAVDSSQSTLRTAFVDRIARDYLRANAVGKATFLHLGAEGLLSGDALKQVLKEVLEPRDDQQTSKLIVIDSMESLADWIKSGDTDTFAISGVMRRIWEHAELGVSFILGGDWSARSNWLDYLPDLEVIQVDRNLLDSREDIIAYFRNNFAKELTLLQADAIRIISWERGLNDFEQILLCDRIRRYGDLRPEGVSQDDFLLAMIRTSATASTKILISSALSELALALSEERMHAVTDAISVICASRQGVSLFDLQQIADSKTSISADEWALMRGCLGPLLMGTIGRIRCINERARAQIADLLGERILADGRQKLRAEILNRAAAAASLEDLLDPARVRSLDLRWLVPDITEEDPGVFLWKVLNPALWLSLAYHDWMLGDREISALFTPGVTFDLEHDLDHDPWSEIDHLASLICSIDESSPALRSRLEYALDKAELITNGPETYSNGALKRRVIACGFAQRRGIFLLNREVSDTTLGWSMDWARAISQAQDHYPESVVERAWVEFSLFLVLWMQQSEMSSGLANMEFAQELAHRRLESMPPELAKILQEIGELSRDAEQTPVEMLEDWQSRLTAWVRERKKVPFNRSALTDIFQNS